MLPKILRSSIHKAFLSTLLRFMVDTSHGYVFHQTLHI